jgi:hypothetical protein
MSVSRLRSHRPVTRSREGQLHSCTERCRSTEGALISLKGLTRSQGITAASALQHTQRVRGINPFWWFSRRSGRRARCGALANRSIAFPPTPWQSDLRSAPSCRSPHRLQRCQMWGGGRNRKANDTRVVLDDSARAGSYRRKTFCKQPILLDGVVP